MWIAVAVFLLNVVYGLLVMRDMSQAGAVLVLSLFNTIVVGYGLSFWVLLAERSRNNDTLLGRAGTWYTQNKRK